MEGAARESPDAVPDAPVEQAGKPKAAGAKKKAVGKKGSNKSGEKLISTVNEVPIRCAAVIKTAVCPPRLFRHAMPGCDALLLTMLWWLRVGVGSGANGHHHCA